MIKVVFDLASVAVGQAVAFHLFDNVVLFFFLLLVFPSAARRIRRPGSPRRSAATGRTRTLRQLVRQRLLDPLLLLDVTVDL
jgi:hypothetical protein